MISPEFSRSAILYGGDAQKKMESATVAVCGVGAVGSFALEALARIGVGSFVLVDADTVECIVAKNRHGETSTVPLGWDGAHTRFMDVDFKR